MSLIESALEKLRGGREGEPAHGTTPPRTSTVAQTAKVTPVVPPPREYHLKRIAVDTEALRRAGYLPDTGLERRFADQFRRIKRALIDKALSGAPNMRFILITSALPGDGKTFTSLNLSLSMARERDISVLLVDADAPRAQVSGVLDLRSERGLLDALVDETVDVESLVIQTDIPGFEVLPAGKRIESAPELFASTRMEQIATRLAARNPRQLIVFDSAPLLVSSEARALLKIPGQVALVVRSGATPHHAAIEAAAQVDRKKLQGVILNRANIVSEGSYYGYSDYGEEPGTAHAAGD
jgi:exopolysaccharide/PEP-CTERM locus tyrosine autokinase